METNKQSGIARNLHISDKEEDMFSSSLAHFKANPKTGENEKP